VKRIGGADIVEDAEKLARYEEMHRNLLAEYQAACGRMEELRGQGKTKTVAFKTLFAKKLNLREWLDIYERYGLGVPSAREI